MLASTEAKKRWKSFESVSGEERLKMGWVVKKSVFSFLDAEFRSKYILIISPYKSLSIYTNFNTLGWCWLERPQALPSTSPKMGHAIEENFVLESLWCFCRKQAKRL